MNLFKITVGAAAMLSLLACTDAPPIGGDDSGGGDSATPNIELLIAGIDWNCDLADGSWWYYAKTDGWAGLITLDIHETGSTAPWTEGPHDLGQVNWDPDGLWDEWDITLQKSATTSGQVDGSTTAFECGYHDDTALAWKLQVYDDTNALADCAVWGWKPEYWLDSDSSGKCIGW